MKRKILHIVLALCIAGAIRADQTIQSVQQALKDQGYYYGNVSGEESSVTTAAIRRYQIRNGLQVNGEINQETVRSLNLSSTSPPPIASTSPTAQPNRAAPFDRSRDLSPLPSGGSSWRPEMNRPFAGPPYELAPPRMSRRIVVTEVQRQLMNRGYYPGWIDGSYGRRTAFAVRAFQFQLGLLPTGQLDARTLDALGLSDWNVAFLESAPWPNESWTRVDKKFKHGKWKLKWKKHHQNEDGDEKYVDEDNDGHGHKHDD